MEDKRSPGGMASKAAPLRWEMVCVLKNGDASIVKRSDAPAEALELREGCTRALAEVRRRPLEIHSEGPFPPNGIPLAVQKFVESGAADA